MQRPLHWEREADLCIITDIQPQLASWDGSTHPSQVRLQKYLADLMSALPHLPDHERALYAHLDIALENSRHLLKHHDLENYLTPLFGARRLDPSRFVLVSARKFVGGKSRLLLGTAKSAFAEDPDSSWSRFTHMMHGSLQSRAWKENLRAALADASPQVFTSPLVEVQIAWLCSPRRNWVNLWKPTGDCMGPVLGEDNPSQPFSPNDDRIVQLSFHRANDVTLGNDVQVDICWRTPIEYS